MEEMVARLWNNLLSRVGGPFTFRLLMQPIMAGTLALLSGLRDARLGRPPYFWTILTDKEHRVALIREGWRAIARVFFLAVIIDAIYQWIVQRWIYPAEALIVALCLAVLPYLLIRGPVNRLVQRWRSISQAGANPKRQS